MDPESGGQYDEVEAGPRQIFVPNKKIFINREYVRGNTTDNFLMLEQEGTGYTTWSTFV
jgi:hypothetical protein